MEAFEATMTARKQRVFRAALLLALVAASLALGAQVASQAGGSALREVPAQPYQIAPAGIGCPTCKHA